VKGSARFKKPLACLPRSGFVQRGIDVLVRQAGCRGHGPERQAATSRVQSARSLPLAHAPVTPLAPAHNEPLSRRPRPPAPAALLDFSQRVRRDVDRWPNWSIQRSVVAPRVTGRAQHVPRRAPLPIAAARRNSVAVDFKHRFTNWKPGPVVAATPLRQLTRANHHGRCLRHAPDCRRRAGRCR
jgi:hypothetical protein